MGSLSNSLATHSTRGALANVTSSFLLFYSILRRTEGIAIEGECVGSFVFVSCAF